MHHRISVLFTLLALSCSPVIMAEQDLSAKAASHYQQQQWQQAIDAYRQLLAESPEHEQAWYRLAQAHIALNQGQAAMEANARLHEARQVPMPLVWYQQAQARMLAGDPEDAVKALQQAVKAGYSNTGELHNNSLWDGVRESASFQAVVLGADKNLRPCLHDARYQQFDFWLGEWEVYGNPEKTGPLFGHNSIRKTEQGCLLMEHWQGASGSTGTSMNYYDGIADQWVQRWVSGGGTVIDYAGGLMAADNAGVKAMRLTGKIYYAQSSQQPQIRDFRGTWTPMADGVVRQFFEESTDGGETWYSWFDGYYFPRSEVTEHE
jgi:tetratricopeptide (TPR) repeat protein